MSKYDRKYFCLVLKTDYFFQFVTFMNLLIFDCHIHSNKYICRYTIFNYFITIHWGQSLNFLIAHTPKFEPGCLTVAVTCSEPFWALPHPTELCGTLLSLPHPIELQCTLLSYTLSSWRLHRHPGSTSLNRTCEKTQKVWAHKVQKGIVDTYI